MNAPEVIILGAGPAGATASLLLASWGHSVRVITKGGVDHSLVVSLPPSCGKLFDAIGVSEAIARAAFVRSTGNTVWWGGRDARVEPFAPGVLGWQVEVSQLAQVILQRAVAAGAVVERQLIIDVPKGFVLDCSGRAGIVARAKKVRRHDAAIKTIALVGAWRRKDFWPVPDETHTWIESYDDGWAWSVPWGYSTRQIAAMVDPQRSGLIGGSKKGVYLAEIAKTREFTRLTADASLIDGPWGWDASEYDAIEYAGDDWMLVGDAGSFIDPLSSAGVKKALASGWLAAVVAHTCLTSPSMKTHALAFFSAREREIAQQMFRESRRFLSEAASGHHRAFWEDRADDETSPSDRAAVQRAFDRLKQADSLKARIGEGVAIEARPMIRGNEIALAAHLVPPNLPQGVRYVSGIDIVALAELAPAARQVPDLYHAYVNRVGSVSLHDFLHALATALSRGWLVVE